MLFSISHTADHDGGVNAIPAVVDAPPGFITHLDLGLMPLRGLVR